MTNEERQQAIEWLKRRPVMMAGAKRMYDLAVEALEAYVPDTNVGDTISRQAAESVIGELPPVQPNHNAEVSKMGIIRCKDCKHWNLQVGNVKGDGLGSCDFHNVNLVTGEGFCYWADRRGESE